MSKRYNAKEEPIWQWLKYDWNYLAPKDSNVVTNLSALKGEPITEVMRWENDEWEMFAGPGPDVDKNDIRIVSLGIILGIDSSLESTLALEVGKGIWRDDEHSEWNNWETS